MMWIISALAFIIPTLIFTILSKRSQKPTTKRATVVVFGDIGRSPRISYHARSLLQSGYKVDMVGYTDTPILPEIRETGTIHSLSHPSKLPSNKILYILGGMLRVFYQTAELAWTLFKCPKPTLILVQNRTWI
jgi:beta-1,4-mannosyltransferase